MELALYSVFGAETTTWPWHCKGRLLISRNSCEVIYLRDFVKGAAVDIGA